MWLLLSVSDEAVVSWDLQSSKVVTGLNIQHGLLGGPAANAAVGWEFFLRLLTGGPTHDLSVWLGLPTALKLDFDRDHPNRGNSMIPGEIARLLMSWTCKFRTRLFLHSIGQTNTKEVPD